MGIAEMLDELKKKAHNDSALREELLATRKEAQPYAAFCKKCRELGYEIYEMDLITAYIRCPNHSFLNPVHVHNISHQCTEP